MCTERQLLVQITYQREPGTLIAAAATQEMVFQEEETLFMCARKCVVSRCCWTLGGSNYRPRTELTDGWLTREGRHSWEAALTALTRTKAGQKTMCWISISFFYILHKKRWHPFRRNVRSKQTLSSGKNPYTIHPSIRPSTYFLAHVPTQHLCQCTMTFQQAERYINSYLLGANLQHGSCSWWGGGAFDTDLIVTTVRCCMTGRKGACSLQEEKKKGPGRQTVLRFTFEQAGGVSGGGGGWTAVLFKLSLILRGWSRNSWIGLYI